MIVCMDVWDILEFHKWFQKALAACIWVPKTDGVDICCLVKSRYTSSEVLRQPHLMIKVLLGHLTQASQARTNPVKQGFPVGLILWLQAIGLQASSSNT